MTNIADYIATTGTDRLHMPAASIQTCSFLIGKLHTHLVGPKPMPSHSTQHLQGEEVPIKLELIAFQTNCLFSQQYPHDEVLFSLCIRLHLFVTFPPSTCKGRRFQLSQNLLPSIQTVCSHNSNPTMKYSF